jgi:hypothetical protein
MARWLKEQPRRDRREKGEGRRGMVSGNNFSSLLCPLSCPLSSVTGTSLD